MPCKFRRHVDFRGVWRLPQQNLETCVPAHTPTYGPGAIADLLLFAAVMASLLLQINTAILRDVGVVAICSQKCGVK